MSVQGFWGLQCVPGKTYTQIVSAPFRVSMAALSDTISSKDRSTLCVKVDKNDFALCSLVPEKTEQQPLDLTLVEGEEVTFYVKGDNTIHLTGNYIFEDDEDEYSDDDEEMESDEENWADMPEGMDPEQMAQYLDGDEDSEDDEDFDDEELDEELDEDDEEEDSEDDDEDEDEEEESGDEWVVAESSGDKKKRPAEASNEQQPASKKQKAAELMQKEVEEQKKEAEKQKKQAEKQKKQAEEQKKEAEKQKKQAEKQKKQAEEQKKKAEEQKKKAEEQKKKAEEQKKKAEEQKKKAEAAKEKSTVKKLPNGLIIEDIKIGTGEVAKSGKRVGMRYIGKLTNGKVFDKNVSGKPFNFLLGRGEVIKGWDIGVAGMKIGGERKLTIPAPLAYGKRGAPPDIPGNATLIFEVKLLAVK
ncbi:uncharacterized protein BYT42DRAFT_542931 [Radiomyces spectabilis]|uniref:uncharacterized protein n=1 Tax=Radiomyces spectabilis TaxID=64574 RepID=UPI00221F8E7A|nr:uncharacterized protein BYT42DRAFT_542931 [Radiomyces spectabilis]KAI8391372.1 hypothetical protein BYT42DRAFT_542931 [Radiomyces spectabilis]